MEIQDIGSPDANLILDNPHPHDGGCGPNRFRNRGFSQDSAPLDGIRDVREHQLAGVDDVGHSNLRICGGIDGDNIVGGFADASGGHYFLFDGTTYTTLDVPGRVYGIDGNNIVGSYTHDVDGDRHEHGFLYTIPEPSTLILLTTGALGLLARGWRRRHKGMFGLTSCLAMLVMLGSVDQLEAAPVQWPIADGHYGGKNYEDVDISWWKNLASPVSFFAWNDSQDFFAGYDHGKKAGVAYVANHHTAPGMKFFTFGLPCFAYTSLVELWLMRLVEVFGNTVFEIPMQTRNIFHGLCATVCAAGVSLAALHSAHSNCVVDWPTGWIRHITGYSSTWPTCMTETK